MTLTSQYIKFITDSQRRLEDEEVRDNWLRIPNKLNYNMNLTNQTNNQSKNKANSMTTETHARSFSLRDAQTHIYMWLMYGLQIAPLHRVSTKHWHAVADLQSF